MTVTKILGEQSGIQYQGVKDKSEADPRDALINALFAGEFKNGPFNKPFKVTAANIRAKLGFDPDNLQYQAIEDLLKEGVPFVWVMRVKSGAAEGVSIDTSNLTYPLANGIIAFKLNDPDKRISINVNGKDLKGSMAEVIDELAIQYQVYVTYLRDGEIIFTTSSLDSVHIAVTGIDGHDRDNNFFVNFDSDNGYCDVIQAVDIYTFSLIKTRDYAAMPNSNFNRLINNLELDNTVAISMAKSALAHSNSDLYFNQVILNNWVNDGGEAVTNETLVTYSYPVAETLTFAQVQQRKNEYPYDYTYKGIVCYTLVNAINTALNLNYLEYVSNIGEFNQLYEGQRYRGENQILVYMDFSKVDSYMVKGYMPMIGRPS